jgi:hypothetical protein
MDEVLDANMLSHLHHLHCSSEDALNPNRISICGYDIFALHHVYMDILRSDYWSIVDAAQSLDYLNWDQFSSVNLWSKVSIIVTIL